MAKGSSSPAAPDPYQTAAAQYQYGTKAAGYNKALNSNNSTNPLGSQTQQQTGTDPTTGAPIWGTNTTLAPQFQSLLNKPLDTSQIYGGGANSPSVQGGNKDVQDALYRQQTSYLDPQFKQEDTSLDAKLAAMGATPGSEAWNNEMGNQGRKEAFSYGQARDSAITGATAQQGQLQNIASQGLNAQQLQQSTPISLFNALSGGGPASASVSAPDIMSAFNNQYQGQLNSANASNASANSTNSSLASLAAMYLMFA